MLHHRGDGNRGHDEDGGDVELGQDKGVVGLGVEERQSEPGGFLDGGEVNQLSAEGGCQQGHQIASGNSEENRDDFDHALAPDVADNDDCDGNQGKRPAGGGVGHGGRSQSQTDEDDDRSGYDRREESHYLLDADELDDQGQDQVEKTGNHDAAAGVLELFSGSHVFELAGAELGYGGITAEEGERGSEEGRNLELGQQVEQQGSETGHKQSGLHRERQAVAINEQRNQYCRAEHGEEVLKTQDEHFGRAQRPGVADRFLSFLFGHPLPPKKKTTTAVIVYLIPKP